MAEETESHHSQAGKTSPLVMVLVVAASLAVLTVILMAFVLRSTTASAMKNDNDGDDTAGSRGFCCIDDAAQVASALNTSGDLCEDFYGYVCSRHEDPNSNYMSPVFRMFMKWRLMRMLRLSTRQSDAGALMATLRSGMVAKRAAREVVPAAVLNMMAAIATWAKAVLSTTDPATIIRFFAEASLRYGLPSGVAFVPTSPASEDSPSELSLLRNADCDTILASRNLTAATVVKAFGEIWNTTVEAEQVVDFSEALSKLRSREDAESLVQSLKDSPFSVLPNKVWNEIVSEFVSPAYPNMITVRQAKGDRLNDVLGAMANAANRQVTAAYIVVCTSINAYEEMRAAMDNDRTGVFLPSCDELGLCELEEVFKAEVISTQKADGYIRDYFSYVVDDVAARALDSSTPGLFSSGDKKLVIRYLKGMKVMLPKEISVSDLGVPKFNVSDSFAENLLLARSYAYDLKKARVAKGIPAASHFFKPEIIRRDNVVFVPSNLYMLLKINSSASRSINVPAIGVGMAMEVWLFLLEKTTWSQETLTNIEALSSCFRRSEPSNGSEENDRGWLKTISLSLGFASIIDPERQEGWSNTHTVGKVTMTEGQLCYLMWVYNHCDSFLRFLPEQDINRAIRNSSTFVKTFGCRDVTVSVPKTTCPKL
ncbi:hypothetical protein HPB51_008553 [Rhipicephalus microplus]|uniref:Uncharacterized protein n=1 Tax=Rhipicephalus microplus TaxID=6941 RepID=A0A9J6D448_RHIMP|nr:hypothetical protein HPB51_008553 [Rhipicephalus microplus]